MSDLESNLLLARYLVEDNDNDYVKFNYQAHINIDVIKSRFKTIVGPIKVYSNEEENSYQQQLINVSPCLVQSHASPPICGSAEKGGLYLSSFRFARFLLALFAG